MRICSIENCKSKHKAKGLCKTHYVSIHQKEYRIKYRKENKEKILNKQKENYKKNKDRYSQYNKNYLRIPEKRFNRAIYLAKLRGYTFNLTIDQYKELIAKSCYYCDGKLGKVEFSIGLDRIDNNKGYDINNVQPCCGICNVTRNTYFTVAETKAAINAILSLRESIK